MSAPSHEPLSGRAFDRASPVHAYWVTRCVGFAAVDSEGRPLGQVRRAEQHRGELVLARRLGSRRVSVQAVDLIWPHDRIILLSDAPGDAGETAVRASGQVTEDTLPWFDLSAVAAASDEAPPSVHQRAAVSAQKLELSIGRSIRWSAATLRERWRRFRIWMARRVQAIRERSARGLFRLAEAVEPSSHDAQ